MNDLVQWASKPKHTHAALQTPEYLDQVQPVRAHIHSAESKKVNEKGHRVLLYLRNNSSPSVTLDSTT